MLSCVCARIRIYHEIANVHHLTSIQKTNYNLTATAVSDATVTATTTTAVVGDALFSIPFTLSKQIENSKDIHCV